MEINKNVVFVVIALLSVSGCNAETVAPKRLDDNRVVREQKAAEKSSANEICKSSLEEDQSLPIDVLVGTDVESVQNFVNGSFATGIYQSENGGAEIIVTLHQSKDGLVAERQYLEPGMSPEVMTYTNLCYKAEHLYGQSLQGKFVKGGLLWLEWGPENQFLPADLWIYLKEI